MQAQISQSRPRWPLDFPMMCGWWRNWSGCSTQPRKERPRRMGDAPRFFGTLFWAKGPTESGNALTQRLDCGPLSICTSIERAVFFMASAAIQKSKLDHYPLSQPLCLRAWRAAANARLTNTLGSLGTRREIGGRETRIRPTKPRYLGSIGFARNWACGLPASAQPRNRSPSTVLMATRYVSRCPSPALCFDVWTSLDKSGDRRRRAWRGIPRKLRRPEALLQRPLPTDETQWTRHLTHRARDAIPNPDGHLCSLCSQSSVSTSLSMQT